MLNKRWINKKTISAVHDDDLEAYLSSLGILEEIRQGLKNCAICEVKVLVSNLGAVVPKEEKILLVCDKPSCLREVGSTRGGDDE